MRILVVLGIVGGRPLLSLARRLLLICRLLLALVGRLRLLIRLLLLLLIGRVVAAGSSRPGRPRRLLGLVARTHSARRIWRFRRHRAKEIWRCWWKLSRFPKVCTAFCAQQQSVLSGYLVVLGIRRKAMLACVRGAIGVGVAGVAVLLGVVVLRHRAYLPARVVARRGTHCYGFRLLLGARRAATYRRLLGRSRRFLLRRARSRVARVANPAQRALSATPMGAIVVCTWCFLPQIVKFDQLGLKKVIIRRY